MELLEKIKRTPAGISDGTPEGFAKAIPVGNTDASLQETPERTYREIADGCLWGVPSCMEYPMELLQDFTMDLRELFCMAFLKQLTIYEFLEKSLGTRSGIIDEFPG